MEIKVIHTLAMNRWLFTSRSPDLPYNKKQISHGRVSSFQDGRTETRITLIATNCIRLEAVAGLLCEFENVAAGISDMEGNAATVSSRASGDASEFQIHV